MSTVPLTRQAVDAAPPLDFEERRGEKQANIQISISPAGLTVLVEYTGAVSSIQAAIERLQKAGVMDLVQSSKPAAPAPAAKGKAQRVQPEYNADGDPCCPKHHKPLREGNYGLYCPAKDDSTERGYCNLKFVD